MRVKFPKTKLLENFFYFRTLKKTGYQKEKMK